VNQPRQMRLPLEDTKTTTLGARVDNLFAMEQQLENLQVKLSRTKTYQNIEALKVDITAAKEELLHEYEDASLTAAAGQHARLVLNKTETWTPFDWPLVVKFIKKNDAYDLLHRRVSTAAVRERIENGVAIPGLQKFVKKTLRIKGV